MHRWRRRALDYLAACQTSDGAVREPVTAPLSLFTKKASPRDAFFISGGTDIWNTVNALLAFRGSGRHLTKSASEFVLSQRLADGTLSHSSGTRGTCTETTAAAALALPRARAELQRALLRHQRADGRFATFIVHGGAGYDTFLTGPSTIAWALLSLQGLTLRPKLKQAAVSALQADLAGRDCWEGHPAFYASAFYPAHLAAQSLRMKTLAQWVMKQQARDGGWGFDAKPGQSAALPTSFALLTLARFARLPAARHAVARGQRWLRRRQAVDGAFELEPAPDELWYAGRVYTTCLAVRALSEISA